MDEERYTIKVVYRAESMRVIEEYGNENKEVNVGVVDVGYGIGKAFPGRAKGAMSKLDNDDVTTPLPKENAVDPTCENLEVAVKSLNETPDNLSSITPDLPEGATTQPNGLWTFTNPVDGKVSKNVLGLTFGNSGTKSAYVRIAPGTFRNSIILKGTIKHEFVHVRDIFSYTNLYYSDFKSWSKFSEPRAYDVQAKYYWSQGWRWNNQFYIDALDNVK